MNDVHPIRLESLFHETIWGGRRLERDGWKQLPSGNVAIGEAWETEISTVAQNEPYAGKTLKRLVEELGPALLGEQVIAVFGRRFPLLAKFIDANDKLSLQVHPDDRYAALHEEGSLGKTEYWYVLGAEPGASIVHGFKAPTSRRSVQQAIEEGTLEELLHEEMVRPGDVIFVPAGTVHAIGAGVLLYELQEYSDVTYRMYDYGRHTTTGTSRELHIEPALDVAQFDRSAHIKMQPVLFSDGPGYEDRCLVACRYFLTREIAFQPHGSLLGKTENSCMLLSSLGAEIQVHYGPGLQFNEQLARGQTMVLPAALGNYRLEGTGVLLLSYVPEPGDEAWKVWETRNS
jgi:mannose-6-phosphate isomerase